MSNRAAAGSAREDLARLATQVSLMRSMLICSGRSKSAQLLESARCYLVAAQDALNTPTNMVQNAAHAEKYVIEADGRMRVEWPSPNAQAEPRLG